MLNGMTGRDALRASFAVARMARTTRGLVGGYVVFVLVILWEPGGPVS